MNKFELVREFLVKEPIENTHSPRLLDVGCRGCELREYVGVITRYEGLDFFQNATGTVTHVMDLGHGLPFPDRSYDYVVALDVVEHIDDMQRALSELLRVSDKALVVMFPNMAHAFFRIRFLTSGRLSEKYDIHYAQGPDRHRWLTILPQTDTFMEQFARHRKLVLTKQYWSDISRGKSRFSKFCRVLKTPPSVWAWATMYTFRRNDQVNMVRKDDPCI